MAPIRAQNTNDPASSSEMSRLRASYTKTKDPARNPTAIPTPWGEMASLLPKWKRSRTFQVIEATRASEVTRLLYPGPSGKAGPSPFQRLERTGRKGRRPQIGHPSAQQQPTRHVCRVVNPQIDAGQAHRPSQAGEDQSHRGREVQVPRGYGEESEKDGRVAAGPGGAAGLSDQQADVRQRVVGTGTEVDLLPGLSCQPRRSRRS